MHFHMNRAALLWSKTSTARLAWRQRLSAVPTLRSFCHGRFRQERSLMPPFVVSLRASPMLPLNSSR